MEDARTNKNRSEFLGKQFTNNLGYTATIIKYENYDCVTVQFDKPYASILVTYMDNLKRGAFKNNYAPSVQGVGILGDLLVTNKWYRKWEGMIIRCYSSAQLKRSDTYADCTVCSDWHYLPNFAKWADKQNYEEGWELDKDILIPGNREYGPNACTFAPKEINIFLVNNAANRGLYKLGVSLKRDKFRARISRNGKHIQIGTYNTEDEAHEAYVKAKELHSKKLAEIYKVNISIKLYKAMRKYTVAAYNQ